MITPVALAAEGSRARSGAGATCVSKLQPTALKIVSPAARSEGIPRSCVDDMSGGV